MRNGPHPRSPLPVLLAALCAAGPALADPTTPSKTEVESAASCWPGEPGTDPALCPPNDPRFSARWEFRSDIPPEIDRSKMHPKELELGAIGFSLDRAWQYTTGRDDVVIAVLDSGIVWGYEDLNEKLFLNRGELPPPAASSRYDANGDGVFTVSDYQADPRVHDLNANGMLDPQDLILTFSDCKDDDGNGYPDDICGYDFFSGSGRCGSLVADNDPGDDTGFRHGTGIAATAAAETDNGIRDAGVCPGCRILPVRVGDSFVVDANQFAEGAVFAAQAGASVIAAAVGAYNNTPAARAAVDFVYDRGVALIASAADEFSYHHNYPSTYNHALYVNAIRYNHAGSYTKASTFWGLNPCTNFGARVWVTVPALSCSSGATSRLAGVAGLIQSAALDAGLGKLHPEELYQLLRGTADDLDNSEPDWGALRYPARAGFDQLTGYGRINALRAVSDVQQGRIPPIVDLSNPNWFAIVSPRRQPTVEIRGRIRLPRAKSGSWELSYALGVEPLEKDYVVVSTETVDRAHDGRLGTLDFTELPLPEGPPPTRREERDRFSVTLRLRVTDDRGLVGEARRSFFVYDDPRWMQPFPLDLGASGEAAPVLFDLDDDGADEIVLPTADGLLRVLRWSKKGVETIEAPLDARPSSPTGPGSWHSEAAGRESALRAAAVGDIDADGRPEIVVVSREGKVYVFRADGERVAPFPVGLDRERALPTTRERRVESAILTRPVLADLDGRPGLEIVVAAADGHLYVWNADGSRHAGFPVRIALTAEPSGPLEKVVSTPAIGDIDGDGTPEILLGSNELAGGLASVWAVRASGNLHPQGAFVKGWAPFELPALRPDLLPTLTTGVHMTPALLDIDGDGDVEAALYAVTGSSFVLVDHREEGPVVISRLALSPGADASLAGTSFLGGTGSPLVADTDHDGNPEIYAPLLSFRMLTLRSKPGVPIDVPLALGGWELQRGATHRGLVPMLEGYPRRMEDLMIWARPAVADVDGDGTDEVLMGSGGYLLHAFSRAGGEGAGFPGFTGGWIFSGPAVGDLDGDGGLEVVTVTREGYLFVWKIPGSRARAAEVVKNRPAR